MLVHRPITVRLRRVAVAVACPTGADLLRAEHRAVDFAVRAGQERTAEQRLVAAVALEAGWQCMPAALLVVDCAQIAGN